MSVELCSLGLHLSDFTCLTLLLVSLFSLRAYVLICVYLVVCGSCVGAMQMFWQVRGEWPLNGFYKKREP